MNMLFPEAACLQLSVLVPPLLRAHLGRSCWCGSPCEKSDGLLLCFDPLRRVCAVLSRLRRGLRVCD